MKLKSYNKRKVLGLLLLPVVANSLATMVHVPKATAATVSISAVQTTPVELTGTDTLTVSGTGVLDLTGMSSSAVYVDNAATGVSISNSGQIIADADYAAIDVDINARRTTITNLAGAQILAPGSGTALWYGGSLDGTLTNAGTIAAGGADGTVFSAYAVDIDNTLSGTLTNSGTGVIKAEAGLSDTYLYGYSIYGVTVDIGNRLAGTMVNAGTIEANASLAGVSGYYNSVYGIAVDAGLVSGTLENSGTIKATASIDSSPSLYYSSAYALGVVGGNLMGTFKNSGPITATATVAGGEGNAYAQGVGFEDVYGTLTNSNQITATATVDTADIYSWNSRAQAYGISLYDLNGKLTNTSTVKATASVGSSSETSALYRGSAYAIGLEVGNILANGSIDNTGGTIEGNASISDFQENGRVYAAGLSVNSVYGTLDLNGTIKGTVTVADSSGTYSSTNDYNLGSAYGINTGDIGTLNNSAILSAMATADNADGSWRGSLFAAGAGVGSIYNGLTNAGTVTGEIAVKNIDGDTGYYTQAYLRNDSVYGVLAADVGTLTNSGIISAKATVDTVNGLNRGSVFAAGLDTWNIFGTLTNSNTISAEVTVKNYTGGPGYNGYNSYHRDFAYGLNTGSIGTLTNNGTISAKATADTYSANYGSLYAAGADIGTIKNSLTNAGTISGEVSAKNISNINNIYYGTAYGLSMGDVGALSNSGIISAKATADTLSNVYRGSFYAGGADMSTVQGTLTNTNTISGEVTLKNISDTTSYARGSAFGLYAWQVAGTLDNQKDVKATVTATENNAPDHLYGYATGMSFDSIYGKVVNSSAVEAKVDAALSVGSVYVGAEGLFNYRNYGTLENKGTIKATATGTANTDATYARAYVTGVTAGSTYGALNNSGTIEAAATTSGGIYFGSAYAAGLVNWASLEGTVTNQSAGKISAVAKATGVTTGSAYAGATGAYVGSLYGTFSNAGTLSGQAIASGESYAYGSAYGFDGYRVYGTLENSGSMTAEAQATSAGLANVYGYGVGIDMLEGVVDNKNTISAKAVATGVGAAYAEAVGVYVSSLYGSLNNSGMVSAMATASGESATDFAAGVQVNYLSGTLNNSGTVTASATLPGDSHSLWLSSGDGVVNNQAGGLLSGDFFAGDVITVNNSGTIALPIGANGDGSNINVNALFNQDATGVLSFGAMSSAEYAKFVVADTATFADGSGLDVSVGAGHTLDDGDQLLDVVTAGTLAASSFNVTDNNGLLAFTAAIDGNTVDLTTERLSVVDLVNASGNTGVAGVAGVIDAALDWAQDNGGAPEGFEDLLSALRALQTEEQVAEAMEQLVPTLHGDAKRQILSQIDDLRRVIWARQAASRGMNSGDQFFTDRNIWIAPFGSFAEQDESNGTYGYDSDTYGIMVGADARTDGPFTLGAAFGYSSSDIDGDNGYHDADVDSYGFVLYGTYHIDERTDLDMYATYGIHENDSKRDIPLLGLTAKGDYDGWSTSVGAKLGHDYPLSEATVLTASARANYTYLEDDGYKETGAGAQSLKVDSSDVDELILAVDGKITHQLTAGTALTANLGVGYDALADEGSITSNFVGAPGAAFKTEGVEPDEWIGYAGAGLVIGDGAGIQTTLRYDAEIRDDFTNQSVSVKVNVPF